MDATETYKILVVDDNPSVIKLTTTLLEGYGYVVIGATGGSMGIEMAIEIEPDLILLDISMPDMSGLDVCRSLRSNSKTKDTPIIFVTGIADYATLKTAFEVGGTDYVFKPVNKVELEARVKSALNQQKLKKIEIEREKLTGALEMAGTICHELNQPMQVISIYSNILKKEIAEDNPVQEDIDVIKKQVTRMGTITKKLMNITTYVTRDYVLGYKIIDLDKAGGGPYNNDSMN